MGDDEYRVPDGASMNGGDCHRYNKIGTLAVQVKQLTLVG